MSIESNYVIVIATLSDWLKNLAPVCQPMERKTTTNCGLHARFSRALSKLHGIATNLDWFIALFAPPVNKVITLVFVYLDWPCSQYGCSDNVVVITPHYQSLRVARFFCERRRRHKHAAFAHTSPLLKAIKL